MSSDYKIYDREWLCELFKRKKRQKHVYFWGHRGRADGGVTKACFSQWWSSPFEVNGARYVSAEHWMMAEKARLFGADDIRIKILATSKPGAAKALGRQVEKFDAGIWDERKYDIVVQGNVHKFSQNTALGSFLIGTGSRILVEASPVDKIWGIGLAEDDPKCSNPLEWKGQNLLGFALMSVRDILRKT